MPESLPSVQGLRISCTHRQVQHGVDDRVTEREVAEAYRGHA